MSHYEDSEELVKNTIKMFIVKKKMFHILFLLVTCLFFNFKENYTN